MIPPFLDRQATKPGGAKNGRAYLAYTAPNPHRRSVSGYDQRIFEAVSGSDVPDVFIEREYTPGRNNDPNKLGRSHFDVLHPISAGALESGRSFCYQLFDAQAGGVA